MSRRAASKRELINTGTDKSYVRRDEKGHFKESDDVGRSLVVDRRQHSKTKPEKGQGEIAAIGKSPQLRERYELNGPPTIRTFGHELSWRRC